ncbi:MAG: helix-turn-helix transcriptional regulator [Bacteroidales bacterium]|nr:helix-turn-helix transcriptional regulator [Bacteroidales bacterium]
MRRDWLIAIREEKKVSQKYVSEQVGIAQPSYFNIEAGKRSPSVPVAKKIAAVLGFDWTQFYEEAGAGEDSA